MALESNNGSRSSAKKSAAPPANRKKPPPPKKPARPSFTRDWWGWAESVLSDALPLETLQRIILLQIFLTIGLIVMLAWSVDSYSGQLRCFLKFNTAPLKTATAPPAAPAPMPETAPTAADAPAPQSVADITGTAGFASLKIQYVYALNRPIMTQRSLLTWASAAATKIMTFGFNDFDTRMSENRVFFTPRGWDSFVTALKRSGVYGNITKKRQIVTAAPLGAPVITKITSHEDHIEWTLQLPYMVTYLSGSKSDAQKTVLSLVVTDVPPSQNLNGFGIDEWLQGD